VQQQTAVKRRSSKPAAAPFSPAAAKLIAQVQAEARAQLLTELSAKDTIVVLHGFDAETRRVQADGSRISISDKSGNQLTMHRNHLEPESWRSSSHMAGHWHPARWYGHQTLVDASGTAWDRQLNIHVCDDFGSLVEVAA
jgi:hypothetical protein